MAFTRDWVNTNPIDHTKFKNMPGEVRNVREDLEERLASILYGLTAGETYVGLKKGRFITIGTGAPSAPSGTGAAVAMDVYARANGTGTNVELWCLGSGNAVEIQLTHKGKIPLDLSARLANNGWLIARNAADAANVNIIKLNTANAIELGTGMGSHIVAPDTAPTANLQYAPKGYVDAQITANKYAGLGAWTSKNTGTNYQAATDGFVIAYTNQTAVDPSSIIGYSDSAATPTTKRAEFYNAASYGSASNTVMFPVRKTDYYRVDVVSWTATMFFLPIGS